MRVIPAVPQGHSGRINVLVALSSRQILSSSTDSTRLWSARSGALTWVLTGHLRPVTGACESSNGGTRVVTASEDGTCEHSSPKNRIALCACTLSLRSLTLFFSLCSHPLIRTDSLRSWLPATGAVEHVFDGHLDKVTGVVAISDNRVVSCSADRTLRTWNVLSGECGRAQVFEPAALLCSTVRASRRAPGFSDKAVRTLQASPSPSSEATRSP